MRACWSAHLVQFGLGAGEGEGEAHRELFVLNVLLLHEVAQTVGHVAEELKVQRKAAKVILIAGGEHHAQRVFHYDIFFFKDFFNFIWQKHSTETGMERRLNVDTLM